MKKITLIISLFLLSFFNLYSQEVDAVREFPQFDKINVSSSINVYPSKGDAHNAKVVASGIDIDNVVIEVRGKTLHIGLTRGIHRDYSVEVYLTYTQLREVDVTSSGRVSFQDTLTGDKVTLKAGTNAQIDVEVNLKTLDLIAGSGGSIRLGGKVGSYEALVRTAGVLSASDLAADTVFVSVASRGVAKVNAKDLIDANVRSGGSLTYTKMTLETRIQTGVGATVIEQ